MYEGWFSCEDFPRLMDDRRWKIPFAFVFLDFTSTCGEQPFSHTKSKASECEQLILASTPGKSLRRFRKDNNHLEKFEHTELLQVTKKSLSGQRLSTLYLYVCIYSLF